MGGGESLEEGKVAVDEGCEASAEEVGCTYFQANGLRFDLFELQSLVSYLIDG